MNTLFSEKAENVKHQDRFLVKKDKEGKQAGLRFSVQLGSNSYFFDKTK